jgi:hypothetical protein
LELSRASPRREDRLERVDAHGHRAHVLVAPGFGGAPSHDVFANDGVAWTSRRASALFEQRGQHRAPLEGCRGRGAFDDEEARALQQKATSRDASQPSVEVDHPIVGGDSAQGEFSELEHAV